MKYPLIKLFVEKCTLTWHIYNKTRNCITRINLTKSGNEDILLVRIKIMNSTKVCKPQYLLLHMVTVCSSCWKWRKKKNPQSWKSIALLKEELKQKSMLLCRVIVLTVMTNYSALERQWEFLLNLECIRETHKLQYIFLPLCGSEEFVTRRREKLRMMMVAANESWNHVFLRQWCVTNGDVEQRNLFISSS